MAHRSIGIDFTHVLSCDNDEHSKAFFKEHFSPHVLFDDIHHRDLRLCGSSVETLDLYVAGFS